MPLLFNFYVRQTRSKSWKIWHREDLRKKRTQLLLDWWQSQLLSQKITSCPVRPGDEIFDLGAGNIIHEVIKHQRWDVLEYLIKKGLSGLLQPQSDFSFTKKQFLFSDPAIAVGLAPNPLMKSVLDDSHHAFKLLLKDQNRRLWKNSPHLPLFPTALAAGSARVLDVLFKHGVGVTKSDGLLCVKVESWRKPSDCRLDGEHLLYMACQFLPDSKVNIVWPVLCKHIDIAKELQIDNKRQNMCVLKSISLGKHDLLKKLLQHGGSPHPAQSFQSYYDIPLYAGALQPNPQIVFLLIERGATWQYAHWNVGEALTKKIVFMKGAGIPSPSSMNVAHHLYSQYSHSASTKEMLLACLKNNHQEQGRRKI